MNSNQQVSNFIYYYPKVLDSQICNSILTHYNKDTFKGWKTSTFSTTKSNTGSSKVDMKEYWIGPKDMFYKDIQKGFEMAVDDYVKENNKINVQEYTRFRINCYETGGFMKEHIDNIHHSHGQKQGYPHLTSLIFLNDDYGGGEFTLCGESLDKDKGSAVVFPSNFMFPHEVEKVTSGVRYSIMTWVL
jgi:Rps23 Pro-64 3,4-dihydroxylase Tpa1-like proline 4-hydroxylase|tara:strand:- start:163 stop:726 length:564 start_codon:yes stop_codon:yes gene_type:complete